MVKKEWVQKQWNINHMALEAPFKGVIAKKYNSTLERRLAKATSTNSHSEITNSGLWGRGAGGRRGGYRGGIQHRTGDNVKVLDFLLGNTATLLYQNCRPHPVMR